MHEMNEGYFSSNRDKSIDIYHFKTNIPQILYNTIQKENQYCFMLTDSGAMEIDTTNLRYVWDFGDGIKASGSKVNHCFRGAGKYTVKLDIIEKATGNLFFSKLIYNLELLDYKQPYINSPDIAVKEETLKFDGLRSNLPGFKVLSYYWNFGDGNRSSGDNVRHAFKENGEFS